MGREIGGLDLIACVIVSLEGNEKQGEAKISREIRD